MPKYFRFYSSKTIECADMKLITIDCCPGVSVIRDCNVIMTSQQSKIIVNLHFLTKENDFLPNPLTDNVTHMLHDC